MTNLEIKKIDKKVTDKSNSVKKGIKKIGNKREILLNEDFVEKIINKEILDNISLEKVLNEEGTDFTSILNIIDSIIKYFPEKEISIIKDIFQSEFGFNTSMNTDNEIQVSLTLQNLFSPKSSSFLGKENIEKIFNANILPLQITDKKKKKGLVLISRTGEMDKDILNILEPLSKSKNISYIEKVIIVDKKTYNQVLTNLTVFRYADEI